MQTITNEEYLTMRNQSTIDKMYIVQRGNFRKLNDNYTSLVGRAGLIDLDYMGSSEYEWGAVPYSYRRIMNSMNPDSAHDSERMQLFVSDIQNCNGVPLYIFCHKYQYDDICTELKLYLAENSPSLIVQYRLKERIGFHEKVHEWYRHSNWANSKDNFWWDLKNDFMFFFGAADRENAFKNLINNDYNNWWMYIDETERNALLGEATRG